MIFSLYLPFNKIKHDHCVTLKDIHNIQFQYNIAGIQRQSMIEVVLGYGLKNYSHNHTIELFCISNKINWMKISLHLKQPISFYVVSQFQNCLEIIYFVWMLLIQQLCMTFCSYLS